MARGLTLEVFLRGGLGNQLFQYCSGLHFAEKQGRELVLRTDLLPEVADVVGGISRWPLQISSFNHSARILDQRHQPPGRTNVRSKFFQLMRILGDLQPRLTEGIGWISSESQGSRLPSDAKNIKRINSYATFKGIAVSSRARLRSEVRSLVRPSLPFRRLQKELTETQAPVIHIRRGDYVGLEKVYGRLEDSYFTEALMLIREKGVLGDPWLFSDSPNDLPIGLRESLGVSRLIGPKQLPSPLENLVLMSSSAAFIGSNSSFSWWASLLSDPKAVIVGPIVSSARTNNYSEFDTQNSNWNLLHVS